MPNDPGSYRQSEAQTLRGVLARFEAAGYVGQFGVRDAGMVMCFTCHRPFDPRQASVETVRRLEGASDPSDMLAVLPIRCPSCGALGTLVLNYGPEATAEDAEVLTRLPPPADRTR